MARKKGKDERQPGTEPEQPRKANINVNVPAEIRERVNSVIERSGLDLTQVIIKALSFWLPRAEQRLEEQGDGNILF